MECGKLTAKLRDAVPVCFIENGYSTEIRCKKLKSAVFTIACLS